MARYERLDIRKCSAGNCDELAEVEIFNDYDFSLGSYCCSCGAKKLSYQREREDANSRLYGRTGSM